MTTQCPNCHQKMHCRDTRQRVYYGYQCVLRHHKCPKCGNKSRTREVDSREFDELLAAKHKLDELYREAHRRKQSGH